MDLAGVWEYLAQCRGLLTVMGLFGLQLVGATDRSVTTHRPKISFRVACSE
jgi:hypothetical protein